MVIKQAALAMTYILVASFACTAPAQSRALFNSLVTGPMVYEKAPAVEVEDRCDSSNQLGSQDPRFTKTSAVLKELSPKLSAPEKWSKESLSEFYRHFTDASIEFKSSLPESTQTAARDAVLARVSSALDYKKEATLSSDDLLARAQKDRRWRAALTATVCQTRDCVKSPVKTLDKSTLETAKAFTGFPTLLENALIAQMSEWMTVDEMLATHVTPDMIAKNRIFSALLHKLGAENKMEWACANVNGVWHLSTRVVIDKKDLAWNSEDHLEGSKTFKTSQICFSSQASLNDFCEKQ